MLIFGGSVGDWREKAAYAIDKADNDFAKIRQIRCEGIEDVPIAMAFMAALAADTKCKNFIYHATVNLFRGERLTQGQWFEVIDDLEKRLELEGHYRVAFEHIKKYRQHYHIYWLRLPPGNGGPAVNMGNDYSAHRNTAVYFEKKFGLKPAPRKDRNKPSHKNREINQRNCKTRIEPDTVTREVTRIYYDSKNTRDFIKNLAKAGYILTQGKQDTLVLVDRQGGYHGLLRRINGVKTSGLRQKFPELEQTALPSLASVLRNRHSPSPGGFKKTAAGFGQERPKKSSRKTPQQAGHNPYVVTPRLRDLLSTVAEANARHRPKEKRINYPAPVMRKRQQKSKEENKLIRIAPSQAEIESAELLCRAWENRRADILSDFGIAILSSKPPQGFGHGAIPSTDLKL